jgi:hypothetical protein
MGLTQRRRLPLMAVETMTTTGSAEEGNDGGSTSGGGAAPVAGGGRDNNSPDADVIDDDKPTPEEVVAKIKEVAGNVLHTLTTKREPGVLPKPVQDKLLELEATGQDVVTTLQLIRKPMDSYVKELLQGISWGAYKGAVQDSPYDEMFHLSLLVNGQYRLEKNEVIALTDAPAKLPKNAQFMRVALVSNTAATLTLRSLLEKTKEYMGDENFTNYHARSNNCQSFVMGVLHGNNLATELLHDFTYQDAETIFAQMPEYTTAVAVAMTDAAAVADKLIQDRPPLLEGQGLVAELAQTSRDALHVAQQSEAYQRLVQKARDLHEKYGDRIPEDRLRETLQELRLVAPDVSMLRMSIKDKVSTLFCKLGGGNKKEMSHGGSKGSSLGLNVDK